MGVDIDTLVAKLAETAEAAWRNPPRGSNGWLSMGDARRMIAEKTLSTFGITSRDVAHDCADLFTSTREQEMALFDGALATLAEVRKRGISLTLVTNGAAISQRWKINRFDLATHFDHIQIEEEAGVGKPHEDAYRMALGRVDCAPDDVWMIGDHLENDVGGAQRLGLTGVWFNAHDLEPDAKVSPNHAGQQPRGTSTAFVRPMTHDR